MFRKWGKMFLNTHPLSLKFPSLLHKLTSPVISDKLHDYWPGFSDLLFSKSMTSVYFRVSKLNSQFILRKRYITLLVSSPLFSAIPVTIRKLRLEYCIWSSSTEDLSSRLPMSSSICFFVSGVLCSWLYILKSQYVYFNFCLSSLPVLASSILCTCFSIVCIRYCCVFSISLSFFFILFIFVLCSFSICSIRFKSFFSISSMRDVWAVQRLLDHFRSFFIHRLWHILEVIIFHQFFNKIQK